jgi:CheY-like chemotaxis protein
MSTDLPLDSRRILIVDDNPDSADSLGILLGIRGATVEVVHDGPAALALLDGFRPAVVLLDLGMPGMNGFELAERIRQRPEFNEVVLVAQTGWGTQEYRSRSRDCGIDHHLVKPVEFESLVNLLADVRRAPEQSISN